MSQFKAKSPFEFTGGNLCLDFADTVNGRTTDHPEELLTDYGRLLQWAEESGAIGRKTAERLHRLASENPGGAEATLRNAVQLRGALFDIFSAVAEKRAIPVAALAILNKVIRQVSHHIEIAHLNGRFMWDWLEPEANLDSMLWPVARAAADLLCSDEIVYVRECASDTCAWLFLDKTKNHRRRWCDMKICGNRDKARRYYQRQKVG